MKIFAVMLGATIFASLLCVGYVPELRVYEAVK
jgi:hypothetical protein